MEISQLMEINGEGKNSCNEKAGIEHKNDENAVNAVFWYKGGSSYK